jgi:hypothetical protein
MTSFVQSHSRALLMAVVLVGITLWSAGEGARAENCIVATTKVSKNKIITTTLSRKFRIGACKKGEIQDFSEPTGQIRAYGDGSAGDLVVTDHPDAFFGVNRMFEHLVKDRNTQFSSITIPEGKILGVPAGTILRATGKVTIAGTLAVFAQNNGGFFNVFQQSIPDSARSEPGNSYAPPNAGIAALPPAPGEIGLSTRRVGGGSAGLADRGARNTISTILLRGGGGGAPGTPNEVGGDGGGSVMIVAGGPISVESTGQIIADGFKSVCGACGGGGGGGGVIILGSKSLVSLSGKLQAKGGAGAPGGASIASGGGGGGGLIVLAAPVINDTAQKSVDGGEGGKQLFAGDIKDAVRMGGAGGGASAGGGGRGSDALQDGSCAAGQSGGAGEVITILTDPTAFF